MMIDDRPRSTPIDRTPTPTHLLEPEPGGEGLAQKVGLNGGERDGLLIALVVGRRERHPTEVELVLEALEAEEAVVAWRGG